MPHSLMLGFVRSRTGGLQIRVDSEQIAEALWFSRDDVRASVAAGTLRLPPPVSIAHQIIQSWYGGTSRLLVSHRFTITEDPGRQDVQGSPAKLAICSTA